MRSGSGETGLQGRGHHVTPKAQAWVPGCISGPSELGRDGPCTRFLYLKLQVTGRLVSVPSSCLCLVHTRRSLRQQGTGDGRLATVTGRVTRRHLTPSPVALVTLSSHLSGTCAGDTEGVHGPCAPPSQLMVPWGR